MASQDQKQLLQSKMSIENFDKLMALNNPKLHTFIADAIELTTPESVFVCTDSDSYIAYIRQLAIDSGEEKPLAIQGHTCHFKIIHLLITNTSFKPSAVCNFT